MNGRRDRCRRNVGGYDVAACAEPLAHPCERADGAAMNALREGYGYSLTALGA